MAKNTTPEASKRNNKVGPKVSLSGYAAMKNTPRKAAPKQGGSAVSRAALTKRAPKIAPPQRQSYSPAPAPMNFTGSATMNSPLDAGQPITAPEPPQAKTWDELDEAARQDYLKGDATYVAQQAALEQELKNLIAELGLQRTNYSTDYTSALSNMGWDQEQGSFDPNNLLGAYGASFANQENDFANRGMLDSSAYANALTNLGTSFDKQKGDLDTSRSNFLRELETRETGARNTQTQDLQRARADAIARRAAREGLV